MSKLSQEHIINTYIALLAKSPWTEISLSHIASELGVSKPALFHYFSSKQELDDVAFQKLSAEFEAMGRSFEALDARNALLQGGYYMLDHMSECLFFLQLLIARRLNASALMADKHIPRKGTPPMVFAMLCYFSKIGSLILSRKLTRKKQLDVQVDQLIQFFDGGLNAERVPIDPETYTVRPEEIGESRYLKALDKVLTEDGPQSVSMGKFAKALGVAPSTLYSTFKDKMSMFSTIAQIEVNRMLGIVESHLDEVMSIAVIVETIIRTVDSYLAQQVNVALYIDVLYIAFSQRKSFETHPLMLKAFDAVESICPGIGVCIITLPASCRIIHSEKPDSLSMEQMLDYLYHGIKKELG